MKIDANQSKSKDKQYFINTQEAYFCEVSKTVKLRWVKVAATKEEFDNYYRPINTYRRREMEHGRCVCPPSKRLFCNMDCLTCPYRKPGDFSSLNESVEDGEGGETEQIDLLADDRPSVQSIIEDQELLNALYQKLSELDPDGRRICELIMQGQTERQIADVFGTRQSTINYKKKKAFEFLAEALKDYM